MKHEHGWRWARFAGQAPHMEHHEHHVHDDDAEAPERAGPGGFGPGFGPNMGRFGRGAFAAAGFGPGFGPGGFGPGFGPGGFGPGFGPRGPRGGRARRGNVRAAVLSLLAEQPQHGYQLITELERRSGGRWKPSPGSIYPVLSQLADEGLVRSEEVDGRKVFHLTDAGTAAAAEAADEPRPWESGDAPGGRELWESFGGFAMALRTVHRTGTPAQAEQAKAVVDEARRSIYLILAEDTPAGATTVTPDGDA